MVFGSLLYTYQWWALIYTIVLQGWQISTWRFLVSSKPIIITHYLYTKPKGIFSIIIFQYSNQTDRNFSVDKGKSSVWNAW